VVVKPTPVARCSVLRYAKHVARTIPQRELRNDNAKVIEAVTAGETFIVTRNGEPVAELRPIRAGRRTFISRDDLAAMAVAGVRIDHRQFRADLDRSIDQSL
jgi:prevent-host-death family protein